MPSLSAGARLGPYEVLGPLGKGGMGEVYRATDTRLGRPVAIKLSLREFNDRFEREAHAISALNHPNICTLYDVGPNYLVMELVEGETLSKIIERGPLPLDKALEYAVQIADALAAAHAKGVIHRDLKPGNIIITRNGAKVLDFGLARLRSDREPGDSAILETVNEPATRKGAIVGTLYYMAPEQVEGKEADERSDIFALGTVVYEMIAGHRPFVGDTQAAVLASVLKDQPPPISQHQPAIPRALERVVRKCLEKKPDDRWQSARDLKPTLELIDLDAPPVSTTSSSVPLPVHAPARKWTWPAGGAVAVILAAAVAWLFWSAPQSLAPARVTRFEVALPPDVRVIPNTFYVRISPDGTKLAFTLVGRQPGIWIRDLDSVQARVLPGTEAANAPFWSPDSKSLAYAVNGNTGNRLMRIDVAGGPPQILCESKTPVGSGVWTKDDGILFGGLGSGPMQKVPAAGGIPVPVTTLAQNEAFHSLPSLLPDGRRFLYLRSSTPQQQMFIGSLDAKPDQQPMQAIAPAQFGATFAQAPNEAGGVLFFVRDGTLMAQPFDTKRLLLTGDPVPVVQQIGTGRAHAHFSVTPSGVMAYRVGAGPGVQLAWLDRKGSTTQKIGEPGKIVSFSLSPDESQLAIARSDSSNDTRADIWLLDLARNVETRLTTGQSARLPPVSGPVWSPDGRRVAYVSLQVNQSRLYVKDTGGAADAKSIKELSGLSIVTDWTRDGKFLIYAEQNRLYAIPAEGGDATPLMAQGANECCGRVSPDGRWLAYESDRSGRGEVYVRPFTAPGSGAAPAGPVIQISANGGALPKWRADGKELFFVADSIMATAIDTSNGGFRPATPVALAILSLAQSFAGMSSSLNGDRFLLAQPLDQGMQTPITVVTNWEAALKRK